MVAHEILTEPHLTVALLLAKPRSFSNLPVFLDLNSRKIYILHTWCKIKMVSPNNKDMFRVSGWVCPWWRSHIWLKRRSSFLVRNSYERCWRSSRWPMLSKNFSLILKIRAYRKLISTFHFSLEPRLTKNLFWIRK